MSIRHSFVSLFLALSCFVNSIDEPAQHCWLRVCRHAMPQIKDVSGAAIRVLQHVTHPSLNTPPRGKQQGGVEFPLNPPFEPNPSPRIMEFPAPQNTNISPP